MVPARPGVTKVREEREFPTEWTMVDEGANLSEEPKEERLDSEAASQKVEVPLAAKAHA
jgi:hypothetical protein